MFKNSQRKLGEVVPACYSSTWKLTREDGKCEDNQGYIERPCLVAFQVGVNSLFANNQKICLCYRIV